MKFPLYFCGAVVEAGIAMEAVIQGGAWCTWEKKRRCQEKSYENSVMYTWHSASLMIILVSYSQLGQWHSASLMIILPKIILHTVVLLPLRRDQKALCPPAHFHNQLGGQTFDKGVN